MRILITNIVVLNGGDGAILFGMLKALKRAFGENVEIVVFASEPARAARLYPGIQFRRTLGLAATGAPRIRYVGRIVRTVRIALYLAAAWCHVRKLGFLSRLMLSLEVVRDLETYGTADLVVSSGGTYLKEEYGMLSQICDYSITLLLGRPLVFFTQSLGPFTQPKLQTKLRRLFNAAEKILVRDEQSRQNLRQIGVEQHKISLAADAAFALADPRVLEQAKYRKLPADRSLRIAISVRHWPHFKRTNHPQEGMEGYIETMARVTEGLINSLGADVTFLSTCQGIPEYTDDSEIACRVVARLKKKTAARVRIVRDFVRFDALLQQLPAFDVVLATRMHMAILSLIAGTPAIPLALEFKTMELFTNLGVPDWVIDAENAQSSLVLDNIRKILRELPMRRSALFESVEHHRQAALDAGWIVRESVLPGSMHTQTVRTDLHLETSGTGNRF